jgi:integrase
MKKVTNTCPTCGAPLLFAPPQHKTLKALVKEWVDGLELEGRSYSHVQKMRSITRDYIVPHFKRHDIRAIRTIDVNGFYHSLLKSPLASKTVKHILDTLRAFMRWLHALEVIEQVPRFPRVAVKPARERRWIDAGTQRRILEEVPPEHQPIFRVLFETGARPSEVCALKVKDLREDGVHICRAFDERGYLKGTKTGASYTRPLSADVLVTLRASARLSFPEAWLFLLRGTPYNRRRLYRFWKRACAAVGVSISLYEGVRHSRASQRRRELEAQLKDELRKELEHTSARTTLKHYALGADKELK